LSYLQENFERIEIKGGNKKWLNPANKKKKQLVWKF
jgi:hypothetical protein